MAVRLNLAVRSLDAAPSGDGASVDGGETIRARPPWVTGAGIALAFDVGLPA